MTGVSIALDLDLDGSVERIFTAGDTQLIIVDRTRHLVAVSYSPESCWLASLGRASDGAGETGRIPAG